MKCIKTLSREREQVYYDELTSTLITDYKSVFN